MSRHTLGAFVVGTRREQGLTQDQLLQKVNEQTRLKEISRTTLSEIERGNLLPKIDVMFMVADALGVSMDEIRTAVFKEGRFL